jgi:hypothetical protein
VLNKSTGAAFFLLRRSFFARVQQRERGEREREGREVAASRRGAMRAGARHALSLSLSL